jgi:hypothetical protein
MVCQRYIANPLTIDGFKFDLRLYVCVLSFAPMLEAYIHTEGFARYSSVKYAPAPTPAPAGLFGRLGLSMWTVHTVFHRDSAHSQLCIYLWLVM